MTESAPADSGGNNGRTGRGRGRGGRGRGRGKGGKGRGGRGRGRGRGRGDQAADAELPYGGDVQAAMAAQDRDAVRDLLKHQEASRPKPQKDKKKPPQKKKKDKWWRTSTEVDPISLEPLSELDYPPFELGPHLFDGRVLAFYLVSTGTFLNPMSRDELSIDDCTALDAYLAQNNLDPARVADALRLQKALTVDTGRDDSAAQQQQRQATAVLHGLFGFARYGDSASSRPGARRTGGGNLRSAYDDDDRSSGGLIDDGDIGGDESEEEVLPEAAFPSLNEDAPRDIDQGAGWRRAASSQGGVLAASALTTETLAATRVKKRCCPRRRSLP